jgi:hypothetical protein
MESEIWTVLRDGATSRPRVEDLCPLTAVGRPQPFEVSTFNELLAASLLKEGTGLHTGSWNTLDT